MAERKAQDYIDCLMNERGGFDFTKYLRNEILVNNSKMTLPPTRKTGTTICGIVCKDAVVLAADTRATAGPIVADKNCSKLHRIADNIYCAGAGTSADLFHTTLWLENKMELHRLNTNTQPRVTNVVSVAAQELFKYMGHKQCALVLGGTDITGPHLYTIHPHGSTDKCPFAAMGSGSLAALTVIESEYKDNMTVDEGKKLAGRAIKAGIMNDLGSGGNIDICIIKRNETIHIRPYDNTLGVRAYRQPQTVDFPIGTTAILREYVVHNEQPNDLMVDA